jgi:hypothetical protein
LTTLSGGAQMLFPAKGVRAMDEDEKNAQFVIKDSQDCSFNGITHIGDGLTVSISNSINSKVNGVTKLGTGGVLNAERAYGLIVSEVKAITSIDPFLERALLKDLKEKNRDGFFKKIGRLQRSLPVEKLDALVNLWNNFT